MITMKDIYRSINTVIKSSYPTIPIISKEVVEGVEKPYFFVQILPIKLENTSINYKDKKYSVIITFFQKVPDSVKDIEVFECIQSTFGYGLKIVSNDDTTTQQVYAIVSDYDMDYVGQDDNIMQCSFDICYTEYIEMTYEEPTADNLEINHLLAEEEM